MPLANNAPKNRSPTHAVRVENLNMQARHKIIDLFNTLIGDVRSFLDKEDSSGKYLEVTFFSQDAAKKALCMSGYTIAGVPLTLAPALAPQLLQTIERRPDIRRNLYVLGLPFALTKSEFTGIFSRYGAVTHSVILATVDNSSRRRGFIVMSTHAEAKNAMAALTRTQLKGHTLDISWAVVQRSQGFLDGGDRAMLLESRVPREHPTSTHLDDEHPSANSSDTSIGASDQDLSSVTPSLTPTPILLVTNLPALLFSQARDLLPLFHPFGQIARLEILQKSIQGSLIVLVQYESAMAAQEAKQTLQGQCYGESQIEVCYARLTPSYLTSNSKFNTNGMLDNSSLPTFQVAQNSLLLRPSAQHSNASDLPVCDAKHRHHNWDRVHEAIPRSHSNPLHLSYPDGLAQFSPSTTRWNSFSHM